MATGTILLPGEDIPQELLPTPANSSLPLRLGPGLQHIPPSTITPTVAGQLCSDSKRNAIWIEGNGGRYIPLANDLVIATMHHSSVDVYHCSITPHTSFAQLPQLAFEGATKKSRPILSPGALIYARISLANKHMDPELECLSSTTGKADGLGELKGGMIFDISLGMARRLMMPKPRESGGVAILEELAEKLTFEIAVGRNGRVWIDSGGSKSTLCVGKAIQITDKEGLGVAEQVKMVKRLMKEL
ncbi:MAG: exosome non-catalytic core subunit rrp40 [Candelina mexicana]|nr:MAG: exosome non-catalytic core subunit rrp40 [Candelina mexicana]